MICLIYIIHIRLFSWFFSSSCYWDQSLRSKFKTFGKTFQIPQQRGLFRLTQPFFWLEFLRRLVLFLKLSLTNGCAMNLFEFCILLHLFLLFLFSPLSNNLLVDLSTLKDRILYIAIPVFQKANVFVVFSVLL